MCCYCYCSVALPLGAVVVLQWVIVVFPDHTHLLFCHISLVSDIWLGLVFHVIIKSEYRWNFETIRGSLMRPKWPKLASLAQRERIILIKSSSLRYGK